MLHDLKTHPHPFQALWEGRKTFELRKHDRPFNEGDDLKLREYVLDNEEYTGRIVFARVGYILQGGQYGLPKDLCVMSIYDLIRSKDGKHVPDKDAYPPSVNLGDKP